MLIKFEMTIPCTKAECDYINILLHFFFKMSGVYFKIVTPVEHSFQLYVQAKQVILSNFKPLIVKDYNISNIFFGDIFT